MAKSKTPSLRLYKGTAFEGIDCSAISVPDSPPKPKIRLDSEEVITMLASLLNTPPSDSRLDYAFRGYEDAKRGDKCNLWHIRNMGHALIADRDKREEWIVQRQKIYEQAYDLSLSRHFPGKEKEFVRVRK
jgi:hypothetical protein